MCDSRCMNAKYPTCRCSCGGINHGGGSISHRTSRQRISNRSHKPISISRLRPITQTNYLRQKPMIPQNITKNDFLKNVGKGILKGALVYGASAAFPPAAPFLIPAYQLYNYATLGLRAYTFFDQIMKNNSLGYDVGTYNSLLKLSESEGKVLSSPLASQVATDIVNYIRDTGEIKQIASQANVNAEILTSMLRGSLSSGMSSGIGNFTAYTVGSFVGG